MAIYFWLYNVFLHLLLFPLRLSMFVFVFLSVYLCQSLFDISISIDTVLN